MGDMKKYHLGNYLVLGNYFVGEKVPMLAMILFARTLLSAIFSFLNFK